MQFLREDEKALIQVGPNLLHETSITVASEHLLRLLEAFYHLRKAPEVLRFLEDHSFLILLLVPRTSYVSMWNSYEF